MFQSSCPVHKLFLVFCTMHSTSSRRTRAHRPKSSQLRCGDSSTHSKNRVSRLRFVGRDRERETPRSCLVCHDRPSRARYPRVPGRCIPNEQSAKETVSRSRERKRETRRRTVARVATSIRFSSSCGQVVKTFLLPPD